MDIRRLNGFHLKMIAIITMLIDHTGAILYPQYIEFRIIGRLAFPIFCFLLVEGVVHTSNVKRYILRLGIFAIVSEVIFDMALHGSFFDIYSQNVFFTLCLGAIAITLMMRCRGIGEFLVMVGIGIIAELLNSDYGIYGILLIAFMYRERSNKIGFSLAFLVVTSLQGGFGLQMYSVLALLPILCYNGKRGYNMKYIFYVFYPLHLLVLYGIAAWI